MWNSQKVNFWKINPTSKKIIQRSFLRPHLTWPITAPDGNTFSFGSQDPTLLGFTLCSHFACCPKTPRLFLLKMDKCGFFFLENSRRNSLTVSQVHIFFLVHFVLSPKNLSNVIFCLLFYCFRISQCYKPLNDSPASALCSAISSAD